MGSNLFSLTKQGIRNAVLPLAARTLNRPPAGDLNTILIFQPDHLGDIVLSQPAIRLIRENNPEARLIGVVGPWSLEIARIAWPVDELISLKFPGFDRAQSTELLDPYRQLTVETERLRKLRAGRAFVLRPDAWWAAWLAALSVSDAVITSSDPRLKPFATEAVELDEFAHTTERAIAIAEGIRRPKLQKISDTTLSLQPTNNSRETTDSLHSEVNRDPYVVVHPGSGARVKHWPVSRWRQVIAQLDDVPIVLTGSTSEKLLCDRISEGFKHVTNIAGKTDLLSLIEVMSKAELAVGTDNGPMHIAVATGTGSVHLYGPSDPLVYGPWGNPDRHRVVSAGWTCARCGDLSASRQDGCGCMLAISVNQVVEAVHELRTQTV